MRIEKILLKNYRQFREVEMTFSKRLGGDLHVVIADNATGKTNLLNAINWCLYGSEAHLSKHSQQLPRLNLKTLVEAEDGSKETVTVELSTEADGDRIIFTRTEDYVIYKGSKQPRVRNTSFEVTFLDERKNAKMVTEEDAKSYVERFVPSDIREFFFFDGERLDTYFKSATGQQISHATFQISQVDTLDRIAERLDSVTSDFKREAGRRNPEIEVIREDLETKERDYANITNQMAECGRQKEEARAKRNELNERLRGIPNIDELQKEKESLKENRRKKERIRSERIADKKDLLFDHGIAMKLYPSIERAAQIIRVKRERKEIPQTYDKSLLDDIIAEHRCICGRPVEERSQEEEQIARLRKDIAVSSDIAQTLLSMEGPLDLLKEKTFQFGETLRKITSEIQVHEEDLNEIDQKIQRIDSTIGGYNADQIREWYRELKKYEEIYDANVDRIGHLKPQKELLAKKIEERKEGLRTELRRAGLLKELKESINLGTRASELVREIKDTMMSRIRAQIERETRELFFTLIWKRETFKDVSIDEGYTLHLIHSLGYECLGTVSASERQLLALSFILALHRVSGFDSPILVDTPVARVAGEQRENLGRIFTQVSSGKQIILLFTPNEYSTEISRLMDPSASTMRNLKLSEDETEVGMEVLQ